MSIIINSAALLPITEGGSTTTFTVVLGVEPTHPVILKVSSSDEYGAIDPGNCLRFYWPMKYARVSSKRQLPRFVSQQLDQRANGLSITSQIKQNSQQSIDGIQGICFQVNH